MLYKWPTHRRLVTNGQLNGYGCIKFESMPAKIKIKKYSNVNETKGQKI